VLLRGGRKMHGPRAAGIAGQFSRGPRLREQVRAQAVTTSPRGLHNLDFWCTDTPTLKIFNRLARWRIVSTTSRRSCAPVLTLFVRTLANSDRRLQIEPAGENAEISDRISPGGAASGNRVSKEESD
jgi:hypothetical protein